MRKMKKILVGIGATALLLNSAMMVSAEEVDADTMAVSIDESRLGQFAMKQEISYDGEGNIAQIDIYADWEYIGTKGFTDSNLCQEELLSANDYYIFYVTYSVSPKVILTTLQKESSMVSNKHIKDKLSSLCFYLCMGVVAGETKSFD